MAAGNDSIGNVVLRIRMKKKCTDDLGLPAIVFAPHPDDETLGCGGTIVRKLARGAKVEVVFITDGSRSHDLIPSTELAKLRREEGLKACEILGIEADRVHFLGMEDGSLANQKVKALPLVSAIVRESGAEEVFVTHRSEPSSDHAAANRLVRQAIKEIGKPMTVWEYPIWFWDRWPWLRMGKGSWRHPWAMTKAFSSGLPSLMLRTGLNCAVDITEQLDVKRSALAQHRTQMTKYNGDPGWATLAERADGRFLAWLLQPQEYFLRYDLPARKV